MPDAADRLNPHQRAAVLDDSPVCVVNAQVGSGKTTVLIAKVLHLYRTCGVPLDGMVVLTFTNKAAGEIRARMLQADPALTEADMPWFGTFHGVALRMLQTLLPLEEAGYRPGFSVVDPDELHAAAASLILEHGLDVRYANRLPARIEAWRAGRALFGNMKRPDDMGQLWERLRDWKRASNRMDFDDLIEHCTALVRGRFSPRWILADEFQDSDAKLLEFIDALRTPETRVFAVGDPNQAIYAWRGSGRNVLRDFAAVNRATVLSLPLNYRSTGTILTAARSLLGDGAVLDGVREPGGAVVLRRHHNPFNEAEHVADAVARLHAEGAEYRDIAVLYRLQRQSGVPGDVFARAGIPFTVSQRKTLKDFPVLQWTVRLLRASADPADAGSLQAVLMDTVYGASLTRSETRALTAPGGTGDGAVPADGAELYGRIRGYRDWARGRPGAEEVYAYFGLDARLQPTSNRFAENRGRVTDLLDRMDRHVRRQGTDLADGTAGFLDALALHGLDAAEGAGSPDPQPDAVRLMTLHACKGLEFRHVFILGANQGLIPLGSCATEEERAEELRLFFVGVTRARDTLEISYCASPEEPRVLPEPSEYLARIPVRRIDADAPDGGTGEGEGPQADIRAIRQAVRERIARRGAAAETEPEALTTEPPPQATEPTQAEEPTAVAEPRRVRHARYGIGTVRSEDGDTVTVVFEGYGEKTFSKAFTPLVDA